ncbi:MAG: response regulator [Ignavibacteria bacterium]|nr:response regulator [Ignavibacteria bacterium]
MSKINYLILVVEDDLYMNETICDVLEAEGYKVECVLNASDAINKIKSNDKKYHLLILDYNLQYLNGISGLDIFTIAKEKDPDIKAIMISAYGRDKGIKERASSLGISAIIDKPFLITELIDTVDDILNNPDSIKV